MGEHRPTFKPKMGASGILSEGGYRLDGPRSKIVSALDMPAHLTLKERKPGQGASGEIPKEDLKRKLLEREKSKVDEANELKSFRGRSEYNSNRARKRQRLLTDGKKSEQLSKLAEKEVAADSSSDSEDDDSDEDSSEDDELALLQELEKIKKERAEKMKKEKEEIIGGNPLLDPSELHSGQSAIVSRRWDDDVVFKNQAKKEKKTERRFVNDTIRNDFHRKFLSKYIQ
eukprot:g5899.t1